MPSTLKQQSPASHRESLADVPVRMAKADTGAQVSASELPELTQRAIKKAHRKMELAAGVLGISESQIGRLVNDEDLKLKHLRTLGIDTLVNFAKEVLNSYGELDTPQARLRRKARELREIANEVEQAAELIA